MMIVFLSFYNLRLESIALVDDRTIHIVNQFGDVRNVTSFSRIISAEWLFESSLLYTNSMNHLFMSSSSSNLLAGIDNIQTVHLLKCAVNQVLVVVKTLSSTILFICHADVGFVSICYLGNIRETS